MNEKEFIESIDACFPYENERKWRELIDEGIQISDNSSFMVLHEICCAPVEVSKDTRYKMLSVWKNKYTHPVRDLALESGTAIIEERDISIEKALSSLKQISKFNGLYNAFAIVCFSCDDVEDKADDLFEEIVRSWKNQ